MPTAPDRPSARAAGTTPVPPWTLRAAAGLVSIETLLECLAVVGRTSLTPGLRGLLIACVALKWVLAWRVLGLRAGPALGLLMLEGTTVVAALGAVETDGYVRLALAGSALTAVALIAASLHAFPPPTLPSVLTNPNEPRP
jgi:hypothetical protein